MPVATMLAVASLFWSSHGYTPTPVTWDWDTTTCAAPAENMQTNGCADMGGGLIHLSRGSWDKNSNVLKCKTVIHEMGHAVFSFPHEDGTIMAPYAIDEPTPGICLQFQPRIAIGTAYHVDKWKVSKP